ncbi:MAG TPA: hypothetical protein HPP77_03285 [Candidatus Hydrogenedentes bacterium]|nr:hypothetical protein [Candidatus Hydrogenedentota bacterium]HIJ74595.1 hypothetical protein [Candidatus Hydrogenedentota bacterium]
MIPKRRTPTSPEEILAAEFWMNARASYDLATQRIDAQVKRLVETG